MRLVYVGAIAFGAALSVAVPLCFQAYIRSLEPIPPVLQRVDVNPRDDVGSVMVAVRYHIYPAPNCIFVGFHSMWRPSNDPRKDGERIFLLLGGTVVAPVIQTFQGTDFSVHFHLPSSVLPAAYHYTYRLFYQCGIYKLVPFTVEVNAPVIIPPIITQRSPSGLVPG